MVVMKRLPLSLVAAVLLTLVGLAGLLRGAVPQQAAGSPAPHNSAVSGEPMVVSGAYVREPANGVSAAAYFTITNNTDTPDVLRTVESGAGAETSLHTEQGGSMQANSGGLSIPAHGSVVLSPGKGHVMIERLYGPLKAGQSVNFELEFDKNGRLLVTAPVIGVTAPAPTAAPR
jgi:copper(I)-binding protein